MLKRQYTIAPPVKRELTRYTLRTDLTINFGNVSALRCPIQNRLLIVYVNDDEKAASHWTYPFRTEYSIRPDRIDKDYKDIYTKFEQAMNVFTITKKKTELEDIIKQYNAVLVTDGYDDEHGR
jgi:hypothetical protein